MRWKQEIITFSRFTNTQLLSDYTPQKNHNWHLTSHLTSMVSMLLRSSSRLLILTIEKYSSSFFLYISSAHLSLSLLSSSFTLPGFVAPARSSDGECHPDVWALSAPPAKPGRGHHGRRPVGEHLETGEPFPESQRLDAEAGDPCEGMTVALLKGSAFNMIHTD